MLLKLLFDVIQYEFLLPSDFADGVRIVIFMRIFYDIFLRSPSVTAWDLRFLWCMCGT